MVVFLGFPCTERGLYWTEKAVDSVPGNRLIFRCIYRVDTGFI